MKDLRHPWTVPRAELSDAAPAIQGPCTVLLFDSVAQRSLSTQNLEARPSFVRASGDLICGTCQEPYGKHPWATEPDHLGADGPFLRRLCDGRLVKL